MARPKLSFIWPVGAYREGRTCVGIVPLGDRSWWDRGGVAAAAARLLVILRGSFYAVGFAKGTLTADDILQTIPSAVVFGARVFDGGQGSLARESIG